MVNFLLPSRWNPVGPSRKELSAHPTVSTDIVPVRGQALENNGFISTEALALRQGDCYLHC